MKHKLFSILLSIALILSLTIPVMADTTFVSDNAGLLSSSERQKLEAKALEVSEQYLCGVYIITVNDFTDYGSRNIEDFAEDCYHDNNLGVGSERNGILLVMSMEDRDYDLCAYGDLAHTAFTDYGKEVLADAFLDDFGDDDWYNGFNDYIAECGDFLEAAASGKPVDVRASAGVSSGSSAADILIAYGAGAVVAIVIAFVVCGVFKKDMNTAVKQSAAEEYIIHEDIDMRVVDDIFLRTTVTRTKIESDGGGGGGTGINSGGFSHSSGKF